MQKRRINALADWLLVALVGIVVAGCGGGGDSAPTSTNTGSGGTLPPAIIPPPPLAVNGIVIFGRSEGQNSDLLLTKIDGTSEVALAADPAVKETYSRRVDNRIYYQKSALAPFSQRDVWTVNTDGTGNAPLVAAAGDELLNAIVGNRAVYEVQSGLGGQRDLWSVLVDGSDPRPVANNPNDDEHYIGVAGTRVIYEQRVGAQTDVYSINPDGSGLQPIANTVDEEFVGGIIGTRVIFARRENPTAQADLFSMNADGTGAPIPLGPSPSNEIFSAVVGDRAVFQRCAPQGGQCDLYSILLDGTGELLLADGAGNEFFLGTIGTRVFYTTSIGVQTDLWSVDVVAGKPSAIGLATDSRYSEFPEAVVGNRVVFRREVGTQSDLYSIDIAGGPEAALATGATSESFGGAIGNIVIFERLSGGSFSSPRDLFSRVVDGSAPEVALAATTDNEEYAGESGGQVVYERKTGTTGPRNLFSIPPGGGTPVPLGQTASDEFFVSSF